MGKLRIGIFGRMNSGKSTLLNALVGQGVSIVSDVGGTTTDPVRRGYELLGYGPVVFVDTAGFDDASDSGVEGVSQQRVAATYSVAREGVDLAIFLSVGDALDGAEQHFCDLLQVPVLYVRRGNSVESVRDGLLQLISQHQLGVEPSFFGDLLGSGHRVLLVCPIDSEAPAGRLILPQVQALRAALDLGAVAVVTEPSQLPVALAQMGLELNLVVTDSQAFDSVREALDAAVVSGQVAENLQLTSFSVLLARRYADVELYEKGLEAVAQLTPTSKVLLVEYCSHGVSCDDIGRVKIPKLLAKKLGYSVGIQVVSGRDPMPTDLADFGLVIQCGGCMVGDGGRMIRRRIEQCRELGVPITNYGMLLRHLLLGS